MTLKEYLNQFEKNNILHIVGPLVEENLKIKEPVIFVDGGIKFKCEKKLGVSVGDGDSTKEKMDFLLPVDKDISDLGYVLKNIGRFPFIKLSGFLGGRKDHELINLLEVHSYLSQLTESKVHFDEKIIVLSKGEWTLNVEGLISLLCFEKIDLKMNGECKYKIQRTLTERSSHGLSNEGFGEIKIKTDGVVFIFIKP